MNHLFESLSEVGNKKDYEQNLTTALHDVISICLNTNPWLKSSDWCQLHGYSRSQFEKWIENGTITESNGGLMFGTGQTGKHKRVHRFFNPYIRRVDYGIDSEYLSK